MVKVEGEQGSSPKGVDDLWYEGGEEGRGEGGGENSPYVRKHRTSIPLGPLLKKEKEEEKIMQRPGKESRLNITDGSKPRCIRSTDLP